MCRGQGEGLANRTVMTRHVLRNASIPIITVIGIQFATLLGGTVIIESIFGLPGIGRYIYESISARDYPVVLGSHAGHRHALRADQPVRGNRLRDHGSAIAAPVTKSNGPARRNSSRDPVAEPVSEVSGTPLSALTAVEQRAARRTGILTAIMRQRLAMTGAVIVVFFAALALFGPIVAPHGPTEQFSADRLQSPNWEYPFGTDEFGRDILSRILYGARISFQVGIIVVGIAGTAGVLLGMLGGFKGGWVDNIIVLLSDVLFAFPAVLLAIAVITFLGNNLTNAIRNLAGLHSAVHPYRARSHAHSA